MNFSLDNKNFKKTQIYPKEINIPKKKFFSWRNQKNVKKKFQINKNYTCFKFTELYFFLK